MPKPPRRPANAYPSLSLKDLLDARDAYHVHLSNKPNVVATAIGLFRFRPGDEEYPDRRAPTARKRTLSNSVVTDASRPAVLVFVNRWADAETLRDDPNQLIPSDLYLADGRVVPTCVVEVERAEARVPTFRMLEFPRTYVGGGYPVLTDVQGETRFGTISCLATDGELNFAVTARHVAGRRGQVAETVLDGTRQRIGRSDQVQLRTRPFSEVYPGLSGRDCLLNLDIGLIRIDSLADWTSQVYGVGQLEEALNLTPENIGLNLIGLPLRAFGAGSGAIRGEIHALFYRYKSVGGLDYVADVLIGPRAGGTFAPAHGDSGTLWVIERDEAGAERRQPVAIQWGGHKFVGDRGTRTYDFALATFFSTASRLLDVELIRSWEIGLPEYWGKPIHFQIGYHAWRMLPQGKLRAFLEANLPSIGSATGAAPSTDGGYFGLADAPDRWAFGRVRPQDAPNHSANLDLADGPQALGDLHTPAEWDSFYEAHHTPARDRGALPFRIGQVFDAMREAVANRDAARAVFSAGILAHYAADLTMPLHGIEDYKGEGAGTPASGGTNVHKFYDRLLLEKQPEEFAREMDREAAEAESLTDAASVIRNGRDVAETALALMKRIAALCPAQRLFDVYTRWWDSKSGNRRDYAAAWEEIGTELSEAAFLGARFVATLWMAASSLGAHELAAERVDANALDELFRDKQELPSLSLPKLQELLGYR